MNDVERWVNLEGPEPDGIREIMDEGREVSDLTLEQSARMRLSFLAALAEQRRKRARAQKVKWALAAGLLAAAAASALGVLRWAAPHEPPGATAAAGALRATGSTAMVAAAAASAAGSASSATRPPASGASPATQPAPDPTPRR